MKPKWLELQQWVNKTFATPTALDSSLDRWDEKALSSARRRIHSAAGACHCPCERWGHFEICTGKAEPCLIVESPEGTPPRTSLEATMSERLAASGAVWDGDHMCVLSTDPTPEVSIGPTIRVTLLAVSGDSVKIGIAAPDNVPIERVSSRTRAA